MRRRSWAAKLAAWLQRAVLGSRAARIGWLPIQPSHANAYALDEVFACAAQPPRGHRAPARLGGRPGGLAAETMQARRAGSGVQQADPPEAQPAPTAHAIACGLARARTARAGTEEPMRKRQRTQWSDRAWHHNPSCSVSQCCSLTLTLKICQAAEGFCCKLLTHVI